jgi:hypothetical protein
VVAKSKKVEYEEEVDEDENDADMDSGNETDSKSGDKASLLKKRLRHANLDVEKISKRERKNDL